MPTIDESLRMWNECYDWRLRGEEWSVAWGGEESQWYGTIFPRIHRFLPTDAILEIAPGYGRWTQMLKAHCQSLTVVDLADSCIEYCKKRFAEDTHITYHVNDGKSLEMIRDSSIDFVFSFDSLVHAEKDVLEAYLTQLARKLTPSGVGFIHHSNIGVYVDPSAGELPDFFSNTHSRGTTMTARHFRTLCAAVGLQCIAQEIVTWGANSALIDCFSLFTDRNSVWSRPNRILINKNFMDEASYLRRVMKVYTDSDRAERETKSS